MPALELDVALIHMHRGDQGGTGQCLGVDPYFDDLFCMAARKRFMSVEKLVATEDVREGRAAADDPDQPADDRRRDRDAARRALHRVRARLPARRGVPEGVRRDRQERRGVGRVPRQVSRRERGRVPGRRWRRERHPFRSPDPRRGVRGRARRVLPRQRRDPRQPDRHAAHDRRPAGEGDVRARARDDRRRGVARREHPAGRRRRAREGRGGLQPVSHDVRRRLVGPPPHHHGREPDRRARQPELRVHRRSGEADRAAARHARRAGQHDQRPDVVLDPESLDPR